MFASLSADPQVRQDVTFLAVHPPAMSAVVGALRGRTGTATIIVSLAPKLSIRDLSGRLGGFERLARVIPNAASMVGAGFNPVSLSSMLSPMDRERLLSLLRVLGQAPEVPEADLEAYAVLTAMGPTYFWPQWQALREVARGIGLSDVAADAGLRRARVLSRWSLLACALRRLLAVARGSSQLVVESAA